MFYFRFIFQILHSNTPKIPKFSSIYVQDFLFTFDYQKQNSKLQWIYRHMCKSGNTIIFLLYHLGMTSYSVIFSHILNKASSFICRVKGNLFEYFHYFEKEQTEQHEADMTCQCKSLWKNDVCVCTVSNLCNVASRAELWENE